MEMSITSMVMNNWVVENKNTNTMNEKKVLFDRNKDNDG